jgi:hypothetical protein
MARAYVEFVQSQWLPWEPAPEVFGGAEWKRLSHDPDGGACSVLLRWRAGRARLAPALGADWELFVLRGVLQLGKLPVLGTHFYAYLPAGLPLGSAAAGHAATDLPPGGEGPGDGSAIALAFFSRAPLAADAGKPDLSRLVGPIDTTKLRWDNAGIDPNINHLNAARKNLRFAPEGDCRSYLLGGMPQGYPVWRQRDGAAPARRGVLHGLGRHGEPCRRDARRRLFPPAARHRARPRLHAQRLPAVLPHARREPHDERLDGREVSR